MTILAGPSQPFCKVEYNVGAASLLLVWHKLRPRRYHGQIDLVEQKFFLRGWDLS